MTEADEIAACEALKQWFISQEIPPHEGMVLLCRFAAYMTIDNATSGENLERKLKLINTTIRTFIAAEAFRR